MNKFNIQIIYKEKNIPMTTTVKSNCYNNINTVYDIVC